MKKHRKHAIGLCPRCGHMRINHPRGLYVCPVSDDILRALKRFRDENGRVWKAKLNAEWQQGCSGIATEDRELIQHARNLIGPSRLAKIDLGD